MEELGPVFTDSVPLEEFLTLVVEDDVGSELAVVEVELIGDVVKGLTRVVLEVAALGVVGIVVEGLPIVELDVTAIKVVGIVMKDLKLVSRVETSKVFETNIVALLVLRQGSSWAMQEYPAGQQKS